MKPGVECACKQVQRAHAKLFLGSVISQQQGSEQPQPGIIEGQQQSWPSLYTSITLLFSTSHANPSHIVQWFLRLEDVCPSITAFQSATIKIAFDLRKQFGKPQESMPLLQI